VPLSPYDRLRDGLGLSVPSRAAKRVLPGLAGLLVSAAVAAILRERHGGHRPVEWIIPPFGPEIPGGRQWR
jgi:hypothetical protein